MKLTVQTRSTRTETVPLPLCPPQIQVTNLGPLRDGPTTDCLSQGTALLDDKNLHSHAYSLTTLGCPHSV